MEVKNRSTRVIRAFHLLICLMSLQLLVGCAENPNQLFKDGKYEEAYNCFVENANSNERNLKDVSNSCTSRSTAGRDAIENLSKAAECQKKLGNNKKATEIYVHIVELSECKMKVWKGEGNGGWQEVTLAQEIGSLYINAAKNELASDSPSEAISQTKTKEF